MRDAPADFNNLNPNRMAAEQSFAAWSRAFRSAQKSEKTRAAMAVKMPQPRSFRNPCDTRQTMSAVKNGRAVFPPTA
jgi:hypothetical protein